MDDILSELLLRDVSKANEFISIMSEYRKHKENVDMNCEYVESASSVLDKLEDGVSAAEASLKSIEEKLHAFKDKRLSYHRGLLHDGINTRNPDSISDLNVEINSLEQSKRAYEHKIAKLALRIQQQKEDSEYYEHVLAEEEKETFELALKAEDLVNEVYSMDEYPLKATFQDLDTHRLHAANAFIAEIFFPYCSKTEHIEWIANRPDTRGNNNKKARFIDILHQTVIRPGGRINEINYNVVRQIYDLVDDCSGSYDPIGVKHIAYWLVEKGILTAEEADRSLKEHL